MIKMRWEKSYICMLILIHRKLLLSVNDQQRMV
jgi:hypothetical protein